MSGDGTVLLLYYNPLSYYSQKVVVYLYERNLKFRTRLIDLRVQEQSEPWFMKINSCGTIPVLQHGEKVIKDSAEIISYLEKQIPESVAPSLLPKSSKSQEKCLHLSEILHSLPVEIVTYGSYIYPELTKNCKIPENMRKKIIAAGKKRPMHIEHMMKKYPEFRVQYNARLAAIKKIDNEKEDKVRVMERMSEVEKVLDEVEKQLQSTESGEWLFGSDVTVPDINLMILLQRLDKIGLSHYYWGESRPKIAAYFLQTLNRPSVVKAMTFSPVKHMLVPMLLRNGVKILSLVALTTAVGIGIWFYQKNGK